MMGRKLGWERDQKNSGARDAQRPSSRLLGWIFRPGGSTTLTHQRKSPATGNNCWRGLAAAADRVIDL
jgi:hypothetical protein